MYIDSITRALTPAEAAADRANSLRGMSNTDGSPLDGHGHLRQSVMDILGTPIGTRVMRRTYGSRVPELIDRPVTPRLAVELSIAVAEALGRWEPRIKLVRVQLTDADVGSMELTIEGKVRLAGYPNRDITLTGVRIAR